MWWASWYSRLQFVLLWDNANKVRYVLVVLLKIFFGFSKVKWLHIYDKVAVCDMHSCQLQLNSSRDKVTRQNCGCDLGVIPSTSVFVRLHQSVSSLRFACSNHFSGYSSERNFDVILWKVAGAFVRIENASIILVLSLKTSISLYRKLDQEGQLLQRDRATRYIS